MKFSVDGFLLKESDIVTTQKAHLQNAKDTDFESVTIFISDVEVEKLYQRIKLSKEDS